MSNSFMIAVVAVSLGTFILELLMLIKSQHKITLKQTAINVSLGFFDRLVGLYLTERALYLVSELASKRSFVFPDEPWVFILTFFAVDLVWYVFHYLGHRVSIMWSIHLVHHQSEEYNLSVNFALSPLGFTVRAFLYAGLVLMGLPYEYVLMSIYVNHFYQYYLHTEFLDTIPILEKFLVMPVHHKVHHASDEHYLDKNYGGVFIIWDKLFGTFADKTTQPTYGLTTSLPQKDLVNIQLFFFKKLYQNFGQFGFKEGVRLLFAGPEEQTPEIPKVVPLVTRITLPKIIIGGIIYLVSYVVILQASSLLVIVAGVLLSFMSILMVNGVRTERGDAAYRRFTKENPNSAFAKFVKSIA